MAHQHLKDVTTLEELEDFVDEGEHSAQDLIDLWVENKELKQKLESATK